MVYMYECYARGYTCRSFTMSAAGFGALYVSCRFVRIYYFTLVEQLTFQAGGWDYGLYARPG